jgi:Bromodomain
MLIMQLALSRLFGLFICDRTLQFLELPDPSTYSDYYSIITEPRSINGVQEKLQKNRYRNILDVLNDLYLVFANALHYNEASSQISKDAAILKVSRKSLLLGS